MNKRAFWQVCCFLILAVSIAVGVWRPFEHFSYDISSRIRAALRNKDYRRLPIVIIAVGDRTLKTEGLNSYPLPRKVYAQLLYALKELNAGPVVFDILFVEPTEDDGWLMAAIEDYGRVYLPLSFRKINPKGVADMVLAAQRTELARFSNARGHINANPDDDGKIRSLPLVVEYAGKRFFHIAFAAALGSSRGFDFGVKYASNSIIFPSVSLNGYSGKLSIPVADGYKYYLNYPGRWDETLNVVELVDVLAVYQKRQKGLELSPVEKELVEKLKGAICIVGLTAIGTQDFAPTPIEKNCPMVSAHAVLIGNVIERDFITYLFGSRHKWLTLFVFILISLAIFFSGYSVKRLWILYGASSLFYILVAFLLFLLLGVFVDPLTAVLAALPIAVLKEVFIAVEEIKKRQRMETEFHLAADIQRQILPQIPEDINGYRLEFCFKPAIFVAGDFYDVWIDKENAMRLVVGDVSGKGASAALYVSQIVTAGRAIRESAGEKGLEAYAADLNRYLARHKIAGMYATACFLRCLPDGVVEVVDAGHTALWVYRADKGEVEELKVGEGKPIGIDRWSKYTKGLVSLSSRDFLMVFTDGFLEARVGQEFISQEDLLNWVKEHKTESACNVEGLFQVFYGESEQSDDITFFVIRRL